MDLKGGTHAGQAWKLHVLAPYSADVSTSFRYRLTDPETHQSLLRSMQQLRGDVYIRDGAIEPWELTADGCHKLAVDDFAWHILGLDSQDRVCGCARYLEYRDCVSYPHLGVSRSALAQSEEWSRRLQSAVETEVALSRSRGVPFVEVGGWALAESVRNSLAALQIALSAYALARILGGCIGIGTVTLRHGSSSILRRIGGSPLDVDGVSLPVYYDPRYRCQMEILRFDSSAPNPRYARWIDALSATLLSVPVISHARKRGQLRVQPAAEEVPVDTPVEFDHTRAANWA